MPVALRLPGALAELAGGSRMVEVPGSPATVREVLDAVALSHPGVERRVRDETGELRRFVNVYVGDDDVRYAEGQDTAVRDGDVVHVLPSVAGG